MSGMRPTLRETRSQDVNLNALVDGIDTGQVVLPDFQRDFDWGAGDIRALLGTVLNGWPMGSLLLIEGSANEEFYAPRAVDLAPPIADEVVYTILDGQQRLTSMYHALTGKGETIFALKLSAKIDYDDVDSLDEAIISFPRGAWPEAQARMRESGDRLLPFSSLRDAPSFFEWRDGQDLSPDFSTWLTATYRSNLSGIHSYRIPAVIVDSRIEPGAVARVFERVNRTGMKLGTFDLMVAKSYAFPFNLRTAWERARVEHPILDKHLGDDGLPILSAMALREGGDVRQSEVLELNRDLIKETWDETVLHFASAAEFAETSLGVREPEWLPYKQILTVLAALDREHRLDKIESLVSDWFWATAFGRRYDAASNTRAVRDYEDLVELKNPIESPLFLIRENAIEATRGQQGAWHRGYLCALAVDATETNSIDWSRNVSARSVFSRGTGGLKPALHLRSLTFCLWKSGTPEVVNGLGAPLGLPESYEGLDSQLKKLQLFLSKQLRQNVRVVSSEDAGVMDSLIKGLVR